VTIPENQTAVMTVSASDPEGAALTYSLTGSVDDGLFTIDAATGVLTFSTAPDFEAPTDNDGDNIYNIEVSASDGTHTIMQGIAVAVSDVLEFDITSGGVKTLHFSWSAFDGAAYYKLMVNSGGASGFVQEGADIVDTIVDLAIPAHLTDWNNTSYRLEAYDGEGALLSSSSEETATELMLSSIGYFKASNTGAGDNYGHAVALSGDGNTLAVGSFKEASGTTGVNSEPDEASSESGAVYLFRYANGTGWTQQAYIKASNTGMGDRFGWSVALSDDGNTLAVGASAEDSSTTGVNSTSDNMSDGSGAAYLFRYTDETGWTQEAYIKPSNTSAGDAFGTSVALSDHGNTLAVGAPGEDSGTTGINSTPDACAAESGAVYLFRFNSGWSEEAFIKPSNTGAGDRFGVSVALGAEGNTLAVGATGEDSGTTGVNSTPDESASGSGAAYLFRYVSGTGWAQEAYIKALNTAEGDAFGTSIALSSDGDTLAVGARFKDGASGAAYLFRYDGGTGWSQEAYLQGSDTGAGDTFGTAVTLSGDGTTLAVGASGEDSSGIGVGSAPDDAAADSGAAYLFRYDSETGSWPQMAYIKAPNTGASDAFGWSAALSGDGSTLAVGASGEDGGATGINGTFDESAAVDSGAVYLY
ncbi:MAG: cadherin domain-containing protein, partial [Pseudomonadota bacterium]